MGHAKEIITMDAYGDNKEIIADGVSEMAGFMEKVLPKQEQREVFKESLLDIVIDAELRRGSEFWKILI